MEAVSPSIWFPVVTLVVGVFLKALFDSFAEKRRAAFDRESRIEKRKELILMQRIDLQRKALGDVQVAVVDLMRYTAQISLADIKAFRSSGKWRHEPLGDDLNEKSRSAFRQVTLTKVRVRDEHVRGIVGSVSGLCADVTLARSSNESENIIQAAGQLFQELNEKIGEALRALEDEEQALLI